MRNLVDLFVRFSHVFFISHCCNNAPHDELIPPSFLQEENKQAESPPESIQERISSREEAKNEKEVLDVDDDEFYDVKLD